MSAGILALGLVAAPPDINARTEARAVQLAASGLPWAARLGALEKIIGNQGQTFSVTKGGAAEFPVAFVKSPIAGDSGTDPMINRQSVEAAALEAPIAAVSLLDPILGVVSPILGLLTSPGALLLFGPIILFVVLACPPCAIFNFLTSAVSSFFIPFAPLAAVAAAPIAALEANVTVDPSLKSAPLPQADETGKVDVSQPVSSTDKDTQTEQVSTDTEPTPGSEQVSSNSAASDEMTEIAKTEDDSMGTTAVSDPEPSAGASTSEPAKPAERVETPRPRPVVRDSLEVGNQPAEPPHRGNDGRPTSKTADAGASPATAGSSSGATSSAASASPDSGSPGGGSSDGDADGS